MQVKPAEITKIIASNPRSYDINETELNLLDNLIIGSFNYACPRAYDNRHYLVLDKA